MPRGRPRKDKSLASSVVVKKKKKMKAVFIDTIDTIDPDTGYRVNINVYRVQPSLKRNLSEEDIESECVYIGYDSDFIDNLDKDIVPTPLGSAELTEDDIEEEDTDFDY